MKTADPKVIRSSEQHQAYLLEIENLIALNPEPNSPASERLELISVLVQAYERQKFPVEAPDPISAILFRMQEQGLKQADLAIYFGTKSRVSEVLSGKRPLTVNMIRSLSIGLGISAEVLVGVNKIDQSEVNSNQVNWSRFPIKEMISRGWIDKVSSVASKSTEDLVKSFIQNAGMNFGAAAFRRTISGDSYSPSSEYALKAWLARVVQRARDKKSEIGPYDSNVLTATFLRELAQLSWFEKGPLLACEFLQKHGIAVVIEPALKGTLLDGAALRDENGMPIIGLTLRHDRIDNFWFTLLHEVAHVWKHIEDDGAFLDNLDVSADDKRELEANRIAKEALVPRIVWKRSAASLSPSKENIDALSRELKIHPAIIAGKIRRDREDYTLFGDLVGQGLVRNLFNISPAEELL